MKLSILTPTIPARASQLAALQNKIAAQNPGTVEHLIFSDNCRRSIGAKRQSLVDIARGEYIAFVDDDDDISEDYIASILHAIGTGADVITFRQRAIVNGGECEIEFGVNHIDETFKAGQRIKRAPWHICAWKRSVIEGCQFGESNYGEDLVWCQQARKRIRTAHHIDSILHTYRHSAETTTAPAPR